jgi:hypothetical protein
LHPFYPIRYLYSCTYNDMAELMDSRCAGCSPTQYQCGKCAKKDSLQRQTARKHARTEKDKTVMNQQRLFPSDPIAPVVVADQTAAPVAPLPSVPIAPVVVADQFAAPVASLPSVPIAPVVEYAEFEFPPMPSPPPLYAYGQQLFPLPSDGEFPDTQDTQIDFPEAVFSSDEDGVVLPTPKKASGKKTSGKKRKLKASSDNSDSSDTSSDKEEDPNKKVKMPRITIEERAAVCVWIAKTRPDGSMLNARWIRNGGAKGSTMTATSGEVKTSGAYDALAVYVNRKLRIPQASSKFWTRAFSKKRWTAMYVVRVVSCVVAFTASLYSQQV